MYRITDAEIERYKSLGRPTKLMKSGLSLVKPEKITIKEDDILDTDISVSCKVTKVRHSSGLFNIISTLQYKIAEFDTPNKEILDIELPNDIGAIIFTEEIGKNGGKLKIDKLILNNSIRYILYQNNCFGSVDINDLESKVFNQAFISKFRGVWYYNNSEDLTQEVFEAIVLNNTKIKELAKWEIPSRVKDILNYEYIELGDQNTQIIEVHNQDFLNKLLNMEEKSSMKLDNEAW